jgi:septal ring factor EnvC (AmiA/AmiB activator)
MKNFKTWLKRALFDSDRVVKLQAEIAELNKLVTDLKGVNSEYFKQKALHFNAYHELKRQRSELIEDNKVLKKQLKDTKKQLEIQTEMYKNRLKNDAH